MQLLLQQLTGQTYLKLCVLALNRESVAKNVGVLTPANADLLPGSGEGT